MDHRTKKYRLLLVGAETPVRRSILEALGTKRFEFLLSANGQQALQTLRDHLVDGVILNYRTPYTRDGSEAKESKTLEALTDANPLLPLVLICKTTGELSHAASLMADMILAEPIEKSALLDAVDTVLEETLIERARRKTGAIAILR